MTSPMRNAFLSLTLLVGQNILAAPKQNKISSSKESKETKPTLDYVERSIAEAAQEFQVPYAILRAICMTESNLKPDAFVFNDNGKGTNTSHAFGMCQVLLVTAEGYGFSDPGCRRDFRDPSLEKNYKSCKLFGPKVNARLAARYLRDQIQRYEGDLFKGVASYNAGSVRKCPDDGWQKWKGEKLHRCVPGRLLNPQYIKRVNHFMAEQNNHPMLTGDI